jgi:carboxyl-terminal processing protease
LFVFVAGILVDHLALTVWNNSRQPAGLGRTFAPFWEAWNLVGAHYVDQSAVNSERMTHGAILGMLASLGDVGHTTFLTREELTRLEEGLKGKLIGIGAGISVRNHRPTILQTMPDSPARKAGLKPGDILASVDGQSVDQLSLQQVVEKVRGPAGTSVRLGILRQGTPQPLEFTITRAQVRIAEVTWHRLPGTDIGHLAIREFAEQTDAQLRSALAQIRQEGLKGLILDVRGNPGGLKNQAVAVTSEFLHKGDVVFIQVDAHDNRTEIPADADGQAGEIPVSILIDEGTASSAEIFAGALQDHGRAKLVGTRTFGTGTVLQPFPLSDGSAVLLAVARWLTPKGHEIWHHGITPDVTVDLPPDTEILMPDNEDSLTAESLRRSKDRQVLEALEILRKSS